MAESRQESLLQQAQGSSPFAVLRALYDALGALDEGETLDPRWRAIWQANRERVLRNGEAPASVLAEIDKAVAQINSIDGEARAIRLKEEHRVCLLLGAGASAPAPSSIPTVANLLPELWRRARKLGRDDIDRLATWCEGRNVTNIEDLLTAAYLSNFSAKSGSISGLLNYFLFHEQGADETSPRRLPRQRVPSQVDAASVALFQETLQGLFGLLTGTMIPAPPNTGHQAVAEFIGRHRNSTVVTSNYDGCIDEALIKAKLPYSTHIDEPSSAKPNALDLVKIHGSINWSYCDSCHDVKEFDLLKMKEGYADDTISYAVVGICRKCGGQRKPLLIPPMGLKFVMFPNLIRLWNIARERIEAADYIIVVGYSFSEADSYINKIIERSMSLNADQVMIVCDPNTAVVQSLRSRYSARIEGFDKKRVLAVTGSADALLPELLISLTDSEPNVTKLPVENRA